MAVRCIVIFSFMHLLFYVPLIVERHPMINDILSFFTTEGFAPHGFCLTWRADVFWVHLLSDAIISISYFSIPAAIIFYISRRQNIRFQWILVLFGAFIIACGMTHVMSIWTLWNPDYGVEAVLKFITAMVSLPTAVVLWVLMPQALTQPTQSDMERKNAELVLLNQRSDLLYAGQQDAVTALRQSEDRYRGLVETQVDLVVCLNSSGHFTFANETTCRVFGLSRDEIIGRPWRDFIRDTDIEVTAVQIAACLTPPYPRVCIENRILTAEGERWYSWEGVRVLDRGGNSMEVQAVGREITEWKAADEERSNHLLFLESLIEAIPAAVFYKNEHGIYLGCNKMFSNLVEIEKHKIIGSTIDDIFHKDVATLFHEVDRHIIETHESQIIEFVSMRADGVSRHLRTYKAPFEKSDRSQGGMIGIILDISSDILREEELRRSRHAAEQANIAKSGFLANMSHEIRTPMNAILGLVYLLEQTDLSSIQTEYVNKTKISAQSLLGILNDILDISKVEAGRLELESAPFFLHDIMKTLATIISANTRDKPIEVLFNIAPGTPNSLIGDSLRLQQILLNISSNATKFTNRGEVVLSVAPVIITADVVTLSFSIRDTGIGIPSEQISTIFDPFTQADASTTRHYGGTGLGLTICKRLVALMGGEMCVESEVGAGSTFHFTANFKPGVENAIILTPPPELAVPLQVLVADDNSTAREVMVSMVAQFGWNVTVAASGQGALHAIDRSASQNQPFELILLDWVMPEIGGKEVLDYIQDKFTPQTLPVVLVVTAFEQDRVRSETSMHSYVKTILTKPVTPSILLDAVASFCSIKAKSPPGPIALDALSGRSLLLVEDNLINQMVARRILQSVGAIVDVASGGGEALEMLNTVGRHYDAVLMDIQMPGMDGYETTEKLRSQPCFAKMPIIAMTANALPSDRDRCFAAGMNDHIGKPLDVAQMVAIIQRHTKGHEPQGYNTSYEMDLALVRFSDDEEMLRQIMEEFLRQFTGAPEMIRGFLISGDMASIARKAHELKGVVGSIGGTTLANKATILQFASKHDDLELARITGSEVCCILEDMLDYCSKKVGGGTRQLN